MARGKGKKGGFLGSMLSDASLLFWRIITIVISALTLFIIIQSAWRSIRGRLKQTAPFFTVCNLMSTLSSMLASDIICSARTSRSTKLNDAFYALKDILKELHPKD